MPLVGRPLQFREELASTDGLPPPAISRTTCTTVCRAAEPAAMGEGAQHSHSALANQVARERPLIKRSRAS
jgi:hypothetical protein